MPDSNTVILAPGLMGSELRITTGLLTDDLIWVNPAYMLAGGFAALRLTIPGEDRTAPGGEQVFQGRPNPFLYSALTNALYDRGWNVIGTFADWRRGMDYDAHFMAELIDFARRRGDVRIVCHSRGGLVVRKALQLLHPDGNVTGVRRVITIGTPHEGSLNAVKALAGWAAMIDRIKSITRWSLLMGGSPISAEDVCDVVRSWAGVYELLPIPGATWLPLVDPGVLYRIGTYAGSRMNPALALLNAASLNWSRIPPRQSGIDWIDVAGYGVPTATGVPDPDKIVTPYSLDVDDDGDGTVPLVSAHQAPFKLIKCPADHNALLFDGRLFPVLDQALLNGLADDVTIDGAVLRLGPKPRG